MPRREERSYRPIAEEVVVIVLLAVEKEPVHVLVEVRPDVGRCLEPVWGVGVFELPALHHVLGVREVADGPRVVEVQVRLHDVAHRARVYVHGLELVHHEVVLRHYRLVDLRDLAPVAVRVTSRLQSVAAIEEDVAAGGCDQEERNRDLVWFPHPLIHLYELRIGFKATALEEVQPEVLRHCSPPTNSPWTRAGCSPGRPLLPPEEKAPGVAAAASFR